MYNDPHSTKILTQRLPGYAAASQLVHPPSHPPAHPPKPYSNAILFVLLNAQVIAFLCLVIGTSTLLLDFGMSLLMGTTVSIFLLDWRGLRTLDGLIVWSRVRGKKRGLLLCVCIFVFPITVSIYLVRKLLSSFHPIVQSGPTQKPHTAMIAGSLVTVFWLFFSIVGNVIGTTVTTPVKTAIARVTPTPSIQPKANTFAPAALPTRAATPTPRPTHIVTPTAQPTVVPVVQPTQPPALTPTPTPTPQLFLTFTGATAIDNAYASVSVHTLPGAALSISVMYCSWYPAPGSGFRGTSSADAEGNYTWSWQLETQCKGVATATVTASLNEQVVSNTDNFMLQ